MEESLIKQDTIEVHSTIQVVQTEPNESHYS